MSKQLTQDELDALDLWVKGKSMTDAYCTVMRRNHKDISSLSKQALDKRVQRFFGSKQMQLAMTVRELERECAKKPNSKISKRIVGSQKEKPLTAEQKETVKKYTSVVKQLSPSIQKMSEEDEKEEVDPNLYEAKKQNVKLDPLSMSLEVPPKTPREKWLESLTITNEPSAISVWGTGQFILYHAVNEMNKRDRAIKDRKKGTGIFEENGSVFTPMILNAFKVAASMILPFVQTQLGDQQKEITMASALLQLSMDNIKVDPDAYTAPIPPTVEVETIDVTKGNNDENKD